jgi:hypothetical protein
LYKGNLQLSVNAQNRLQRLRFDAPDASVPSFQMSLRLDNQGGRHVGLARYNGPSLLKSLNTLESQNRDTMPPKAVTKKDSARVEAKTASEEEIEDEENIFRPPESDNSDDGHREDIKGTEFLSGAQKRADAKENDSIKARDGVKAVSIAHGTAITMSRQRRRKNSPASSQSNSSPKRKIQEDEKVLGADMFDIWGRKKGKKLKTNTYGSKKAFRPPPRVESGSSVNQLSDREVH